MSLNQKVSRPLRVLYIDHTAMIGGGEVALLNLVRHLDPARVKPIVLLFEDGPLASRLAPDIEVHILALDPAVSKASKDSLGMGSLKRLSALWLTLRHVGRVRRFIRQTKPDLIHTNSLKADIIGGVAGRAAGVPVIWHVRDRITPDYLPAPVVKLFRYLCRTIPQFVIANSKATLETVQLNGRRPSAAIGSGVVLTRSTVKREARHVAESAIAASAGPRIGLVGRISPWKGQDVFLKAAAQVLQQHPTAIFEIIGAALFAEREYEASLHQLCGELGIQSSVRFVGFVNDVPARLEQLDVFVHASTTGEPFGQVIVEAMAAEKPVVATNGGGVPEIVVDGVTGFLVKMGDADEMAKAICDLLAHPDEAKLMGEKGRERVLKQFTIQNTVAAVEDVYQQVSR